MKLTFTSILAACAAALLAACATQPAPVTPIETSSPETIADILQAHSVSVSALSPDDPGIVALARSVSAAELVGFQWGDADNGVRAALTEALVQTGRMSLLVLDVPCDGGATLDAYVGGEAISSQSADLIRSAPIPERQKTAALADMLTLLRGWNAVNTDRPIHVVGRQCAGAVSDPERIAVFWGLDQLPTNAREKETAAAALQPRASADKIVWIVETDDAALSGSIPAPGWLDLRALPERADVQAWQAEKSQHVPELAPDHPSRAEILFFLAPAPAAQSF